MTQIAQMRSEVHSAKPALAFHSNHLCLPCNLWIALTDAGMRGCVARSAPRCAQLTNPLVRARAKRFATKTAFFTAAAAMNRIGRTKSGTALARKLHAQTGPCSLPKRASIQHKLAQTCTNLHWPHKKENHIGIFTPNSSAHCRAISYPASAWRKMPSMGSFVSTRLIRSSASFVPSHTITCPACCE